MAKVLGVGGVFFKSADPKRLYEWYAKWLGMQFQDWGTAFDPKTMPANGQTVWSAFEATADYFAPSQKDFMFNLVVDNLEEALRQVEAVEHPSLGTSKSSSTDRLAGLWTRMGIKSNCGNPQNKEA
jgi:hypothetical protein